MVRLWLSWVEHFAGRLRQFHDVDLSRVDRMVFVCLGNVCRSPFAELIAHQENMPAASLGLSTTTGAGAYADALTTAERLGYDLRQHRAIDLSDFEFRDGDLLLVMEVRQARHLLSLLSSKNIQVALLGYWSSPRRPHIHDPMPLSLEYFEHCYGIIDSAVRNLSEDFRRAQGENELHAKEL